MEYHLYPPFFMIEPQAAFDEAWEEFCRQLLNLAYSTTAIRRRIPPEFGIDLMWEQEGLAFQCKSVKNGQPGLLDITEASRSIQRALDHQKSVGWRQYILCTNVDLTGKQELKLRQMLPSIDFYTHGYWIDRCQKFHHQIMDRFRIPVQISHRYTIQALDLAYVKNYGQHYQVDAKKPSISLLIYTKTRHQLFELEEVPADLTIQELLLLLQELFCLPEAITSYPDIDISFSLRYSLTINDEAVFPHKKLSEYAPGSRPLVALWKIVTYYQSSKRTEVRELESVQEIEEGWIEAIDLPVDRSVRVGFQRFTDQIDEAFARATQEWE